MTKDYRPAAIAAFIGGMLAVAVGIGVVQVIDNGGDASSPAVNQPNPTATAEPDDGEVSLSTLSAADVYEKVRPSVVEITSTSSTGFGGQNVATGTGVIFDDEGYILTNNHVIDGATTIEVTFEDGETVSADLIGTDPANDLAVIQVDPDDHEIVVATLGDSDDLRVGDTVLAIGNPFNLTGTLTQGIVSALDRTYTGSGTRPIRDMIQTDAAINPGNSGGPLLNTSGEVIGINTLLENPTGQSVNVGVAFAVAINTARASLDEMISGDEVAHPWLGIAGMDLTPALAEQLGLDTDSGVYITLVTNGSPADDAGLVGAFASEADAATDEVAPGGDVILSVDGNETTSIDDLASYLADSKSPGDTATLEVLRDGEQITVTVTLGEWPD
jgi:S1-C subfamily serine protease